MNEFFLDCVRFMEVTAKWLGLTYEEWNVILFVIIHPLLTIILFGILLRYRNKYRRLKRNTA